jgi:hypothetical protein
MVLKPNDVVRGGSELGEVFGADVEAREMDARVMGVAERERREQRRRVCLVEDNMALD